METLKFSAFCACQTSRTLVTKNDPRLPCSALRFQTPLRCEKTSSCGSRLSLPSLTTLPRSFRSRYSFVDSYALCTCSAVANSFGACWTSDVNTNSNREPSKRVATCSAFVFPRSLLFVFFICRWATVAHPMLRFFREFLWDTHESRRVLTINAPRSPLPPFESSTEFTLSATRSPGRASSCRTGASKRMARSSQTSSKAWVARCLKGVSGIVSELATRTGGGLPRQLRRSTPRAAPPGVCAAQDRCPPQMALPH